MNLITEHKSEFPSKLRPSITIAASKCRPGIFVSEVYIAATYFFFGRFRPGDGHEIDDNLTEDWWGLDHEIDTEDEAELVIRLFPWILQEELTGIPSSKGQIPIFFLASCSKAVTFIPLFCKLGAELGVFGGKKESTGLTWAGKSGSALQQLFVNTLTPTMERECTNDLDKESLGVLIRLREMGFTTEKSEHQLVWWLFTAAKHREIAFIEARLRLLVDWNPAILMDVCQRTNLLRNFLYRFQERNGDEPYALRLFEVIVELGMSYYPLELGFAFHKTNFSSTSGAIIFFPDPNGATNNFTLACQVFGTETVARIVNKTISNTFGGNQITDNVTITLKTLLFSASTNEKISLEGVYTLVCRDPIAILP